MAYEFHYTPTGTGVISGKEVLEQTEDAINDLGNTAISGVQEALDKAEQALTNSENAVDDAQTALNTANNAEGVAIQAQTDVGNLSGTVTNIGNRVTTAEGNITNLQGRMTTAEGNITNLQGRMTTAEGNIGNLQTAVSTAQATANSAQQTATTARQQSYVVRYASVAVSDNSTVPYTDLNNTDNIKANDLLLDTNGKFYQITSVDTANETVSVTTPLTQLAVDSSVMHLSGDETAAGIKTFSNDLIISLIKSVTNLTTGSSTGNNILPLVASITYTDGTATKTARLNFRIQSDGSIALYPNENGAYTLGLVSRNWDNVFSYMFEAFGKNLGNEFSSNTRTNLYLKANRDTSGQSGVYVSKFRQNRAQGEMGNLDVVQVTFDVLENSVRSNRLWYLNWLNWENDVPKTVEVRSLCEKVDYKLTHINDLNPGSLSLPDLNNGIDISGYFTLDTSSNSYTPLVDGWISIKGVSSGTSALYVESTNGFYTSANSVVDINSTSRFVNAFFPVVKGEQYTIVLKSVNTSIVAKFFPCQGNV